MIRKCYCWLWAVSLIGSPNALGECLEDGDCPPGSRCLVARGYENRCANHTPLVDVPPDAKRLDSPLNRRGVGDPCQFNVDCLSGFACYKATQATAEGQCLAQP